MTEDFYYTIEKPSVAEFRDRGSKFIAYTFTINDTKDFKSRSSEIKKEHPKATHHCYAYRLGLDGNNFRVNDDGEPPGSAGRPILGQIDSRQLTNTLVLVVRYFGGTRLGVPGLINAYKTSTALALQLTAIVRKPVEINYRLQFNYTQMNDVMMIIKQHKCTVWSQQMKLFCEMKIGIPKNSIDKILSKLNALQNMEIEKLI